MFFFFFFNNVALLGGKYKNFVSFQLENTRAEEGESHPNKLLK